LQPRSSKYKKMLVSSQSVKFQIKSSFWSLFTAHKNNSHHHAEASEECSAVWITLTTEYSKFMYTAVGNNTAG
jgi:hypothetical protein